MLSIVLVDDNKADAHLVIELIKDTGIEHEIVCFSNGEQALKFFETNDGVDLILLDLHIPKVSGKDIMSFLKERGKGRSASVVVMTGTAAPQDINDAKELGATCVLVKPMTSEEMDRVTSELKEILLGRRNCNC